MNSFHPEIINFEFDPKRTYLEHNSAEINEALFQVCAFRIGVLSFIIHLVSVSWLKIFNQLHLLLLTN